MALAARAYRLRQCARQALQAGDFAAARDVAEQAQRLEATSAGRALLAVAAFGARSQ
jgi:uncharacterized membrane-anchored protein